MIALLFIPKLLLVCHPSGESGEWRPEPDTSFSVYQQATKDLVSTITMKPEGDGSH